MVQQSENSRTHSNSQRPLEKACRELDRHIRRETGTTAEYYLDLFEHDEESIIELIYTEFVALEQMGLAPSTERFIARFPKWASRLRRQFEIHQFMELETDGKHPESSSDKGQSRTTDGRTDSSIPFPTDSRHRLNAISRGRISDYELVREIGRGATGVVFVARQIGLDRRVAVKLLSLSASRDSKCFDRFHNEAKLLASLRHPHIVEVFDVGHENEEAFLAMELVEGGNLAEYTKGMPQSFPWSAGIIATLARAVAFANGEHVIHRDIKPANVLLIDKDTPKIADFGLAKHFVGDNGLTTSVGIVGTPSYMSPEQAAGKHEVTSATDVYGLGAILYELVTGRPPFRGETPLDTLHQVIQRDPVPVDQLRPDVPRDLATICEKCLRKEPDTRYRDCDELGDDLERFLRNEPIRARRISVVARGMRWCLRHPAIATLASLCACLLLILAIGSPLVALRLHNQQQTTQASLQRANAAQYDARQRLWQSLCEQTRALHSSGQSGQRFAGLATVQEAAQMLTSFRGDDEPRQRLRNEAIACLSLPDLEMRTQWDVFQPSVQRTGVGFDASIERFVFGDYDGRVTVRDMKTNRLLRKYDLHDGDQFTPIHQAACAITADRRCVVAQCESEAEPRTRYVVWAADTGRLLWQAAGVPMSWDHPRSFDLSADGKRIAYVTPDQNVVCADSLTGEIVRELRCGQEEFHGVACNSDGSCVAVLVGNRVDIFRTEDGSILNSLHSFEAGELLLATWSDDDRYLAAGSTNHQAYVWNVELGQLLHRLRGHQMRVVNLDFHPHGDFLATSAGDGTTRFWNIWTGLEELQANGMGCMFSRDGSKLGFGYAGANIGVADVSTGPDYAIFGSQRFPYECYSLSSHPSGKIIATADSDSLTFWHTDRRRALLQPTLDAPSSFVFEPITGDLITAHCRDGIEARRVELKPDGNITVSEPQTIHHGRVDCNSTMVAASDGQSSTILLSSLNHTVPADDRIPLSMYHPEGRPWHAILCEHLELARISVDARWIVGNSFEGVLLIDVADGNVVRRYPEIKEARFAFSPDGSSLLIMTHRQYIALNVGDWSEKYRIDRMNSGYLPLEISFSPDGQMVVVAETVRDLRLLDPDTGKTLAILPSRSASVGGVHAFSSTGTQLAVVAEDMMLRQWDLINLRSELSRLGLDW